MTNSPAGGDRAPEAAALREHPASCWRIPWGSEQGGSGTRKVSGWVPGQKHRSRFKV